MAGGKSLESRVQSLESGVKGDEPAVIDQGARRAVLRLKPLSADGYREGLRLRRVEQVPKRRGGRGGLPAA
jgi:hypothetical protein